MPDQVPPDVVADRYERLAALVADVSLQENKRLLGREVEVLVAVGEGRKDAATHRMSGRARDNRLIHFAPPEPAPRPGDVITTVITGATPHYLLADGVPVRVRSTRGGDAWQARQEQSAGGGRSTPADGASGSVLLGMPGRAPR
jgi:tRNA-2-methylthio-N6-dimethylallyladenosine synthase